MMVLEHFKKITPVWLKARIPVQLKLWIAGIVFGFDAKSFGYLNHPLELPAGETEESLFDYLRSFQFEDGPSAEMHTYLKQDFRRFLYTLGLIPKGEGNLLEIGANPYFTSLLIKKFTNYNLYCTNFFDEDESTAPEQTKINKDGEKITFKYVNYNAETDDLPFDAGTFDVILCCEIIEHMTNDPVTALISLKSLLKEGGRLILTTPNVSRLENVARMITGVNIYDPYSGYGPYGRHNREYNKHELHLLLTQLGFEIEEMFASDVNENEVGKAMSDGKMLYMTNHRKYDLGQYIFIRAKNLGPANPKKPSWLYRSYPKDEMLEE
jgi:SAM-dependent methyltransferase